MARTYTFGRSSGFELAVLTPAGSPDAALAIAASRAGALGILNLEFATDHALALAQARRLADFARGRWGVLVADEDLMAAVLDAELPGLETIAVTSASADGIARLAGAVRGAGLRPWAVATGLEPALAAQAAGADAVVAKGHEAGGWIGEEGAFVLLQRLLAALETPLIVQGGIGLHTAGAAHVAGARGAVLDAQLLLARESPLPDAVRDRIAAMDGSETTVLGGALRVYSRPDLDAVRELRAMEETAAPEDWRASVRRRVDWRGGGGAVLAIGQDAAFAADLARRFGTVGGILGALTKAIAETAERTRHDNPLSEGAALARSHGTRYPLVQGPMTRVSDRAEFAAAVAQAGALPLLALALMRAAEVDALLRDTAALLGERPWGVGILGFVPQQLRAEQLDVVRAHRPPFALIAGGRPDQARALDDDGIATYLHVPSPGLLKLYLAQGARRFVFEGRECGGHVGPRTSFVLWDTMVRILLDELPRAASDCHVLFAGGIHDATSAAMVAAAAAALAERDIRVGALLGTAYLFTHEATEHGAITARFQQAALAGTETALLESGPGHATRCLVSPFVEQFNAEKRRLRGDELAAEEVRDRLEQLNVGRLRIAAKGVDRNPRAAEDPQAPKLAAVDTGEQWGRGLYMIGQVAALRDRTVSLAELHDEVSAGSTTLLQSAPAPEAVATPAPQPAEVAVIGLGCILPGAGDVGTFWANILDKVDAIGEVPPDRWDWQRYYDADPAARDKVYSRWGGFVEDVSFDPMAFGLPPTSLRSIEPFQLLALLTAQAALRDAGYGTRPFERERTSVILGAGGGGADLAVGYTVRSALPALMGDTAPELAERLCERLPEWTEDSFAGLLMNVAAGRIANRLDFGGANYTVDAACASSLAAIGLAVRELQDGTSDLVLAGGVDAIQNPFAYLCFSKTHALSPNGRCRPFDAQADGIAISEGFATVVLKRLADAERDGDRIYAVIRGVGVASDGRDRSLTAPRPEGQMRALRRAYAQAHVSPATVELVEAHGTGTVAGDGAEVQALSTVFAQGGAGRQTCAIGSVKSMIGHTKATAGVAGLAKAALALHHRVLPPTIGVSEPNPKADFASSPFYVNTEARPWLRGAGEHPRRAGVSAFGFGGTDFHVVLEEYAGDYLGQRDAPVDRWPAELLLWRGTREEIGAAIETLAAGLVDGAQPSLADLARTLALNARTGEGSGTLAIVADAADDLRTKLRRARELLAGDAVRVHAPEGIHWAQRPLLENGRIAFLFPGQGSQALDMAREIALAFPEARDCFERADGVLADRYEQPLSRHVFPPPWFTPEDERRLQAQLAQTDVAQPALGAADLAYLHVLRALGVTPQLVAGHSYGELVALAAAGALAEPELLRLSEARGRFMREAAGDERGAMAAIDAAPDALEPLLAIVDVVVANFNAPQQTVVSGGRDHVDAAVAWCRERDIGARVLPVACAFHSPHVAGAQRRFVEELARTPIAAPVVPVYSNTAGDRHGDDPAAIAAVLGEHLVRPVEFVREVEAMHRDGARVFVEVGPRSVLTGLVGRILGEREHLAVPIDRPGRAGITALLHCLAGLAAEGVAVNVDRLFHGRAAEQLDLAAIGRNDGKPAHRPGIWLVNGGRARPADAPPSPPTPEEQPVVTTTQELVPAHHAPPPQLAAPNGDRVGDVMARYQQVMQRFLDTQSSVMLAYLGAPRAPTRAPAPAPALPPPAPAVASAPAVAAEPAAAVPAPAPAGNGHAALTAEEIQQRLLAVVSERTGYPAEMLDLDADLEGDLGIDSIKRVEIAGTLTQTTALPDGAALDVEELTASRTLRQVVATLAKAFALGDGAPTADAPEEAHPFEDEPADEERIGRFALRAASAPAIPSPGALAGEGAVVIVDDETGVGQALADALTQRGEPVLLLGAQRVPGTAEAAAPLVARLRAEYAGAKALVHLAALGDAGDAGIATLLALARALRGDLEAAAAAGGAAVVGASRLGGAFGVDGAGPEGAAAQGAIAGFLKTLAREWPAVRVKAVDLSAVEARTAAEQLVAELDAADGLVEVGYRDGQRTRLTLAPAPLDRRDETEPIDRESVVLVTGGGRGITAEAAIALAERYAPTLVLVGRTPLGEEDETTAGLSGPRDLRRALIEERRRAGAETTPALVEEDCRRILREREVRDTLARLHQTDGRVEHLICDVCDAATFAALIDGIYERHGRIDGVIHGAGVIEDRLVRDKERASLERVMATKAGSARTLVERLRPESLRFLVLFSSVSGRFGNRGQADYAAASEVLNKLAQELDRRWPARVVAINWGPWERAGMVSPEVAREFARRGVALIPVGLGCRLLDDELRRGRKGEAEIVVGAAAGDATSPPLLAGAAPRRTDDGTFEAVRTLRVDHDRYLDDHRVDGRPVLPFAVAMELMAEAAFAACPGREVAALHGIRLLRGVTVDDEDGTPVRISAVPRGDQVEAAIAGSDGPRRHYRAVVALRHATPAEPPGTPAALVDLPPFPMSIEDAYRDLLFHGPIFQRIVAIEGMDARGARALLRASAPCEALADPAEGAAWLLDPILLDAALQVQVLWARLQWDVTLLPAEIGSHVRATGAPVPAGELVRLELRIRRRSQPPLCHADHWFYDPNDRLMATLGDVVGVGTQALNRLAEARS